MPRQPRLDSPDVLHLVMVRGIERASIFRDDADRADFVARLAALAEAGALTVYAWVMRDVANFSKLCSRQLRSPATCYTCQRPLK